MIILENVGHQCRKQWMSISLKPNWMFLRVQWSFVLLVKHGIHIFSLRYISISCFYLQFYEDALQQYYIYLFVGLFHCFNSSTTQIKYREYRDEILMTIFNSQIAVTVKSIAVELLVALYNREKFLPANFLGNNYDI